MISIATLTLASSVSLLVGLGLQSYGDQTMAAQAGKVLYQYIAPTSFGVSCASMAYWLTTEPDNRHEQDYSHQMSL